MDLAKKFRAAYKLTEMYNMWLAARAEILKNTESNIFVFGIFSALTIVFRLVQSPALCLLTLLLFLTYLLWASRFRYIYLKKIGEFFTPKFKSLLSEMECEHFPGDLMNEEVEKHIQRKLLETFNVYATALTEELCKHGKAFETGSNEIIFVSDKDENSTREKIEEVEKLVLNFSNEFGIKERSPSSVLLINPMDGKKCKVSCHTQYYKIFDHNFDLKIV